jgi:hypothetical protein
LCGIGGWGHDSILPKLPAAQDTPHHAARAPPRSWRDLQSILARERAGAVQAEHVAAALAQVLLAHRYVL